MSEPSTLGALGQIARSVRNIDDAVVWYGETLGLTLLFRAPDMAFFDLGGTRLYLQQNAEAGPESILYFAVENIHASHAALLARGVTFLQPPALVHRHDDGTEEWMAFFADPEQRPLALMARSSVKI